MPYCIDIQRYSGTFMKDRREDLIISGVSYSILLLVLYLFKFRDVRPLPYISAILLLIAIIFPKFYKPVNFVVHPIGRFLINIIVNTILTLLYFFVFTPVALIRRALGHRGIEIGFDKNKKTYFIDREKRDYNRDFFEKMY